ncbi:hypothetical protein GCM10023196_037120 [Actinoallomurus vinaceus]|uniref:Small CPxCG-related zinc finger protein n=1 Tax=Actinoallomurus vinaceus TaxID=1080074 RepID=A0ABP8UC34_9ACTN
MPDLDGPEQDECELCGEEISDKPGYEGTEFVTGPSEVVVAHEQCGRDAGYEQA